MIVVIATINQRTPSGDLYWNHKGAHRVRLTRHQGRSPARGITIMLTTIFFIFAGFWVALGASLFLLLVVGAIKEAFNI